ncbi:V-type ATP synthase subunit A [Dactylosporangium matsuzakiense]|uniref:ATP synthase subunit A n=1 Tax=Dactylosporangium matsuzakiense TaxID=53360 RepID=A0A9W6NRE4_9ACTN|nr:V-type ATP synthase subunit A [Dactylosporangium matsuzakiense]UWZ41392.1 V-type ATP synthase subunit A [Dactylosporangium matsuzakiense]GLL06494.1 ATP synthase subunit A [Dactylosporangium matsuzakiense]
MNGVITRVAGPLVEFDGPDTVAMHELVALGPLRLPAEVVRVSGRTVTVQAYEYTGGMRPGDVARPSGRPLAARLGPWLLGGVFDGLLRPLSSAPAWLAAGSTGDAPSATADWAFTPVAAVGAQLGPGELLGTVATDGRLDYRVLVPPDVRGVLEQIVAAGRYGSDATVATIAGRPVGLATTWPVRTPLPCRARCDLDTPLLTGQRAVDLLFPVAKGGTAAVPGGFGTGKTMLLQQIAKWCDADVIVYVGCGERGNEMADVVAELAQLDDPRTGGRLLARTTVVANTSNMPMMAREAGVYTGVTVAEHFRDMGYDVVLIADSTSRWAEALRELAARVGALPAEEGYPADLASALAAFYERAGAVTTLGGRAGSVTILGAVSPPGGDLTEPVTANTERFVRCRWSLDRDLAYARHYPAVSWSGSFSRDAGAAGAFHARHGDGDWAARRAQALALLADADRIGALADLIGVAGLPAGERATLVAGRLVREAVLQQNALSANDAFCTAGKAAAILSAALSVGARCRAAASAGADPARLEQVDFGPLVRAGGETAPDDAAGVAARAGQVLAALDALVGGAAP